MNIFQHKKIDNLTDEFIAKYKLSVPILSVEKVINSIGGHIVYVDDFDELQKGKIMFHNRTFIVRTGVKHDTFAKNVSLGISLGHILINLANVDLLLPQNNDKYFGFTKSQNDKAIAFMYSLLMPQTEFTNELSKNADDDGNIDFFAIARYFHVPVPMVITRGEELQLIMETI